MLTKLQAQSLSKFFIVSVVLIAVGLFVEPSVGLSQDLNLKDQFGDLGIGDDDAKVTLTGDFKIKSNTQLGMLNVTAEIRASHHLYSVTQKKGGPIRSTIAVTESDQYQVIGSFTPDAPPHIDEKVEGFDVPVEHHENFVVWSAPIRLSAGVDPKNLTINLIFNGQVCEADASGVILGCDQLQNLKIEAAFAGYDDGLAVVSPTETAVVEDVKIKSFRPEKSHVLFSGRVVRADGIKAAISPGDTVRLELTAAPVDGFHIYAYKPVATGSGLSTIVGFSENHGWNVQLPTPSVKPYENKEIGYSGHRESVTWSFDLDVPDNAESRDYEFKGLIGFQSCTDSSCDPPMGVKFSAVVPVGEKTGPFPVTFEAGVSFGEAESILRTAAENEARAKAEKNPTNGMKRLPDSAEQIAQMAALYPATEKVNYLLLKELAANPIGTPIEKLVRHKETTFGWAVWFIFLGGFLLNLMPCVFPVLGLKVMGFVEQAGSDPKKIRMHGIAFTMGLVFSMWVLAGIILTLKFVFGRHVNWGTEQMGNPYFVGAMIVLLFLLGLNMVGVFEMGTSLTRVGGGVQGKKGYSTSFLSGILTTLIATPCSGPFLAGAMGYTLAQPAAIAMFLFTVFALGIAFPYVVLSFFPVLINRLPRPGAWMHTFKVTMAFALFATVAFFMQTFGGQTGVVGLSWLTMALVVIGLGAFFYGVWSPAYVPPFKRIWFGWLLPALILGTGLWMTYDAAGYQNLAAVDHQAGGLDWQVWNEGKVESILDKKPSIVWVDYTADW